MICSVFVLGSLTSPGLVLLLRKAEPILLLWGEFSLGKYTFYLFIFSFLEPQNISEHNVDCSFQKLFHFPVCGLNLFSVAGAY